MLHFIKSKKSSILKSIKKNTRLMIYMISLKGSKIAQVLIY